MNPDQPDTPQQDNLFPAPWVPGTLPDLPGELNLLPINLLDRPLRVEFAEWNLAPGQPGRPKATVSLIWDGMEVDSKVLEYPSYTPADLFLQVPTVDLQQSGRHRLRYRIKTLFNDDTSVESTVLIDRLPPSFNVPLGIVRLPAEVIAGGLTQAYLDAHEHQLIVRIGHYPDTRVQDQILLYWRSPVREDDDDVPLLVRTVTQQEADAAQIDPTAQIEVVVPEADIVRAGAGHKVLTYVLRDRAGNASPPSMSTALDVSLAQPPVLQAPTVPTHDDGRVTRADAQAGVQVGVPAYASEAADSLIINWGTQVSMSYPVGPAPSFPLYFPVPWEVLAAGSGAQIPYQVPVRYTVVRGANRWLSPAETINVDLSVAGPPNPDPGPLNPRLVRVIVKGSAGDNLIGPPDQGQPVRVELVLYDSPVAGQQLKLFWGAVPQAVATYDVQAGDSSGQLIAFQVPWADVVAGGTGTQVPVHYITFNGVNVQQSPNTPCSVLLTDGIPGAGQPLAAGQFSRTNANNALNFATTRGGAPYRISLDYRNAAPGDQIAVFVQGFDGSGTQPLPGTDYSDQQPVGSADLVAGYFEFVIPEAMFTRVLFPGARNLVNAHYQVSNLIGRGDSLLSRTLIDMRGDPSARSMS